MSTFHFGEVVFAARADDAFYHGCCVLIKNYLEPVANYRILSFQNLENIGFTCLVNPRFY